MESPKKKLGTNQAQFIPIEHNNLVKIKRRVSCHEPDFKMYDSIEDNGSLKNSLMKKIKLLNLTTTKN